MWRSAPWCHHIKHLGYAGILAQQGKLDYRKLIGHFMRVNGCDKAAFDQHHEAVMQQWEKRSRHQWRVELGEYTAIILPYP